MTLAQETRTSIAYADYERADLFLPWNARRLTFNTHPRPHWIGGGPRFWYVHEARDGRTFVRVDPVRGATQPAFDHDRLAAGLTAATGTACSARTLPFSTFGYSGEGSIVFSVDGTRWRCDLGTYQCRREPAHALDGPAELRSPDGKHSLFSQHHNLFVRSAHSARSMRLTDDGELFYDYATLPEQRRTTVTERLLGKPERPVARWSPDSRKVLTHRTDQRGVGEMHVIQSVLPGGRRRPRLHTYRMALPGDERVPRVELVVFDVTTGKRVDLEHPPLLALTTSPMDHTDKHAGEVWWSSDSRTIYFLEYERGYRVLRLCAADADTGATRTLLEERGETQVGAGPPFRVLARTIHNGDDVLWWSERDGWGHLYRYDGRTGTLRNRLTAGAWVVQDVIHVDEATDWVYFTAGGREPGRNPYYAHLYRVRLDGSKLELLTPEDAHHEVFCSPDGSYFVDIASRVDQPPVTRVRCADGTLAMELVRADVRDLLETGWRWPEPFRVKARDGVTDIYGVLFYPPDFDPSLSYPLLDDIYPGPQKIRSPVGFTCDPAQPLTALGFLVVTIDGLGTPLRSKAFHDFGYGDHYGDAGIPDHVMAIHQLAAERPYIDLERVGIYGHSGGGYASARAMFQHPELFKVGVSSSGDHDVRRHRAGWAERWGAWSGEHANAPLAAGLEGKLLIVYGDMDDTVHHSQCIELIDALIKANKIFDVLVLPNRNHGLYDLDRGDTDLPGDPYFLRRRWDYFVQHLLHQEPIYAYEVRRPDARVAAAG